MDSSPSQLSPGAAWVVGLLCVLAGVAPILIALGVLVPPGADPETAPAWVLVCVGLMFVAAGLAIALSYGIGGGMAPDGDLSPDAPPAIRAANLVLGLTILGLMTAVFGWIALGPGPRHFSTTISLPFLPIAVTRWAGEALGRVVFGGVALLMLLMLVVCGVVGVARLRRAHGRK